MIDWPSLVAAAGGSVVGVAGIFVPYITSREQRAHDRDLARSGRLHDELRDAYRDVLTLLFHVGVALSRTHSDDLTNWLPPPPATDQDEIVRVSASVSIVCSEEIRAALNETLGAANTFWGISNALTEAIQLGRDQSSMREELRLARSRFFDLRDNLERLIRGDMRN